MRLEAADSGVIDANFTIVPLSEPGCFDITVESAGGSADRGDLRNPEYTTLLEMLLQRIAEMDWAVDDIVVASHRLEGVPQAERRIHVEGHPFPFTPRTDDDFTELRSRITRPQSEIGTTRTTPGGNRRKRITLSVRTAPPVERTEFVHRLRATDQAMRLRKPGIADGLNREQIETAVQYWMQVGRDAFLTQFKAPVARKYVVLGDDETEIDAMALIVGARALAGLDVEGPWRGDRTNVATPLRDLGFGVHDHERPLEAPLGSDPLKYTNLAKRLGGTDVAIRRLGRREQRFLRGALGIGSANPAATAACGLCGRMLPQPLLVAAHIKPRHLCSDQERLDMPAVGWALCLLGCDALFEHGYVGVDEHGRVVKVRAAPVSSPGLESLVESLAGRHAPGWTAQRARYFHAHLGQHTV